MDVPAIRQIERASFANPWSEEGFRSLIRGGRMTVQVAEAPHGEILGYAVWWTVAGEAELANIAVRPDRRGAGLGGEILDGVLAEMEERGGRLVFLEVRRSNQAALALYESRGFEVIATRPSYYTRPVEDALIMSRRLAGEAPPPNGKQM
jgi:ribosomal-protein-alanine N-acetyltransferase